MSAQDKILARVRKLLSLSKSGSDAEAALAATRAAELMAEHQLSEAEVRLVDGSKAEPIVEVDQIMAKKRIAWKWVLADAAAAQFGCKGWNQYKRDYSTVKVDMGDGRMALRTVETMQASCRIMGRESAVQAATYTAQYLINEVDRLCEETWARESEAARAVGQNAKAWKSAFRLGAAGAISRRIHVQLRESTLNRARERDSVRQAVAAPFAASERVKIDALALVARDADEIEEVYAAKAKAERFRASSPIGQRVRSRTGYSAGQEMGGKVPLGASRAALGQGPGRLRGGK